MILLGASMSLCFLWWAKESFLSVSTGIVSGQEFAVLERIHSSLAAAQELSVHRQWPGKAEDSQGNINKQQEHGSLFLWLLNLFTQNLGTIPGAQSTPHPSCMWGTGSTSSLYYTEHWGWPEQRKPMGKKEQSYQHIASFLGPPHWQKWSKCKTNFVNARGCASSLLWVNAYLLPHKAALLAQCSLQAHSPQTKRFSFSSPVLQYQLHKRGEST